MKLEASADSLLEERISALRAERERFQAEIDERRTSERSNFDKFREEIDRLSAVGENISDASTNSDNNNNNSNSNEMISEFMELHADYFALSSRIQKLGKIHLELADDGKDFKISETTTTIPKTTPKVSFNRQTTTATTTAVSPSQSPVVASPQQQQHAQHHQGDHRQQPRMNILSYLKHPRGCKVSAAAICPWNSNEIFVCLPEQ